jgi:GDP-4-dehydro-6-deoxy-D-mannose reductase
MRVLITGITGFAGSHLAEFLLERGDIEVFGTYRWRSRMDNINHLLDRIKLIECDLKDATAVRKAISEAKPEKIFHLAAQSFVPSSWNAPAETFLINVISTINLLETIKETSPETIMQIACSSEEYGMVYPDEVPIKETNPLRPLSPYGVSKVAQDLLGYQYHESYGLRTIRTRGFNHTGPRRGDVFVTSNFAKQLAMIKLGKQEPIMKVGNLEAKRDFTDVRDMVRGYWEATEKGQYGDVYNLGSGYAYRIQEVLNLLIEISNLEVRIEQDPLRMRPSDVQILLADTTKIQAEIGWKPTIPFQQTMADLYQYWLDRLTNIDLAN